MTEQTFIPLDRDAYFARAQWHSRQPSLKEEKGAGRTGNLLSLYYKSKHKAEKPRPGARTGWREQRLM